MGQLQYPTKQHSKRRNNIPKTSKFNNSGRKRIEKPVKARTSKASAVPLIQGRKVHSGTPQVTRGLPNNAIRVKFRELLKDTIHKTLNVGMDNLFTQAYQFRLNPGVSTTFPWLSRLAQNYEQYSLVKCSFEYVNAAPATRGGFLYMQPEYNPLAAPAATPSEAMSNMGTVSTPLWQQCACDLRFGAAMTQRRKYVRHNVQGARSLEDCDMGMMNVYYNDSELTVLPGQIWVNYEFILYAPQTTSNVVTSSSLSRSLVLHPPDVDYSLPYTTTELMPIYTPQWNRFRVAQDIGSAYIGEMDPARGMLHILEKGVFDNNATDGNASFKVIPQVSISPNKADWYIVPQTETCWC